MDRRIVGPPRMGRLRAGLIASLLAGYAAASPPARGQEPPSAPVDDPVARESGAGRGVAEFEHGNYEKALEQLRPDSVGSAYYRGLSLLALKRSKDAIAEFERVRARPGSPSEAALDLGVAQLSGGDLDAARATLEDYVRQQPDDPYGHYFLGVVAFRQDRHDEAVGSFQKAAADPALAPYLDFYQGLSAYTKGDAGYRDSLDRFRGASTGGAADLAGRLSASGVDFGPRPTPPQAASSLPTGYGRPVDTSVEANRRWNLAILTGYEYDTNVSLAPSLLTGVLGFGTGKEDSRWTLSSFGEYRLIQRERLIWGLIGSTYDSYQFRLTRFNLQDYMGGTYLNASIAPNLIGGVRYEYHETLLGGDQFSREHRFVPNFSLLEGNFGHTTAYYEFDGLDVTGFALVPAQRRSGDVNAVGLTQAIYLFGGAGRLFAGYRYENAETLGSDFDRDTHMITARVEVPMPLQVVAHAEFRQFWDNYQNPNSLDYFGRARADRRVEIRTGFQKFFTPKLSTRVEYIYTNNNSNVENLFGASFYSYDRHILSALMIFDF